MYSSFYVLESSISYCVMLLLNTTKNLAAFDCVDIFAFDCLSVYLFVSFCLFCVVFTWVNISAAMT